MVSYLIVFLSLYVFFFYNDPPTTQLYTLSLHDALPIFGNRRSAYAKASRDTAARSGFYAPDRFAGRVLRGRDRFGLCREERSEEHTSELQSRQYLVCRLLLEKKKKI